MSWKWIQATGEMQHSDVLLARGYSGHGEGINSHAMQEVKMVGPIPVGAYTIEPAHDDATVGPMAMRLTPAADNEMFGRGDFLIHGDNQKMDRSASEGCIILPHNIRQIIAKYVSMGDDQLEVVADAISEE